MCIILKLIFDDLRMINFSGYSRCRGVEDKKFSITQLAHQWIFCSEWVPSEWESKQLIKTSFLELFRMYRTVFAFKQCLICIFLLNWVRLIFHWRKPYYGLIFQWKQESKDKNVLMMGLFITKHTVIAPQDVNWWNGVMWITCGLFWCFIICLDSHSDGTHSLQRIYWW